MAQHSAQYKKRVRKRIMRRRIFCAGVILAVIASVALGIFAFGGKTSTPPSENNSSEVSQAQTPTEPYVVSTATIGSTGDILIHSPILSNAYNSKTKEYDFNNIYEYITSYYSKYDLMIANLEVTCGGEEAGEYSGYPVFNSPDSLIDAIKNSGIDMLLTANNHTYDTGMNGMLRTMKVLREKGIPFSGTRLTEDEPIYQIQDVNGIKIGICCYTYSTKSGNRKALNGNLMKAEAGPLVNTFTYNDMEGFAQEAKGVIEEMKSSGAEATVFYMHWGNEYHRTPNSYQEQLAQSLCDAGVDVIVGGHPHVIQPFETLKGENGNETVCIYSMGNSVSNQRKEIMDSDNYSGHTEDGMIFELSFQKWSDGRVEINDVNILPTWVNLKTVSGKRVYQVIPLDTGVSDWKQFGLSSTGNAIASYNRTLKLVGEGLNEYRASHGLEQVLEKIK